MEDIKKLRDKINEIDAKMASLFEERMKVAADIAIYKKKNELPIYDVAREREVILSNADLINDDELTEYYKEFLQDIMDISKKYQQDLIIDKE